MNKPDEIVRELYAGEAVMIPYTVKSITIIPYSNGFSARVKGLLGKVENDFETKIGTIEEVIAGLIGKIKEVMEGKKISKIVTYKNIPYNLDNDDYNQFTGLLTNNIGKPKLPQNNMYNLDDFIAIEKIEL